MSDSWSGSEESVSEALTSDDVELIASAYTLLRRLEVNWDRRRQNGEGEAEDLLDVLLSLVEANSVQDLEESLFTDWEGAVSRMKSKAEQLDKMPWWSFGGSKP